MKTRIRTLKQILVLSILSLTAVHSINGAAKEVWISKTATNPSAAGTLEDPYPGDTTANFDSSMFNATQTTDMTIHLLPGAYTTRGCDNQALMWVLKSNTRLIGAGTYATTLQHDNNITQTGALSMVLSQQTATNVEISDLTIDCNSTGLEPLPRNGITVFGNGNSVKRVHVRKPFGSLGLPGGGGNANNECFAISQYYGLPTDKFLIEDCVVSDSKPEWDWVNGIAVHGTGIIRGCKVYLPIITNWPSRNPALVGYNIGHANNVTVEHCYSDGGTVGIYNDTGPWDDTTLAFNLITNISVVGIYLQNPLVGHHKKNTRILYNTIHLKPDMIVPPGHWGPHGIVLWPQAGNEYLNTEIVGNTIQFSDRREALPTNYSTHGLVIDGNAGFVMGNVITHTFMNQLGGANFNYLANRSTTGKYLSSSGLNQLLPFPRREITASGTTISANDTYVAVKLSASGSVTLPNCTGLVGKEIVIVNELNNGSVITVNTFNTGSQFIRPSPSGLGAYASLRVISDGVANWFVQ